MTNETLEKHLKRWGLRSNIIAVVVALFTAMSIGYGFYYNTNAQLDQNSGDIQEIKMDVDEIKESVIDDKVFQGTSKLEIDYMKNQMSRIEEKQDLMMKLMGEYFVEHQD